MVSSTQLKCSKMGDFSSFWSNFSNSTVFKHVSRALAMLVCSRDPIDDCNLRTALNDALFLSPEVADSTEGCDVLAAVVSVIDCKALLFRLFGLVLSCNKPFVASKMLGAGVWNVVWVEMGEFSIVFDFRVKLAIF